MLGFYKFIQYVIGCALLVLNALAQGTISTVAGSVGGFVDNVPALQAHLSGPGAVAVDPLGNSYIADTVRIRRIDALTGIISTVAGDGLQQSFFDGPATQVSLDGPQSFAWDRKGNLLFIDGPSNRAMRLDLNAGTLTTFAGQFASTTPQFGIMVGLATDSASNIFITDEYYDKIYRIDARTGAVTTFAGIGIVGSTTDMPEGDGGPATLAGLGRPAAIAVDGSGNVFFAEQYWLRRVDGKTGIITTIMAISIVNGNGYGDGGPVTKATLGIVNSLSADSNGNLYIADGGIVREINWSAATIVAFAGGGTSTTTSVPATQFNLSRLEGLTFDNSGNLWIADAGNHRLFVVALSGAIQAAAGTSANGDGGPATNSVLPGPAGLGVDQANNLYISAGGSIRFVNHATGLISTIAQGSGPIAVDASGDVFFTTSNAVMRVDAITRTVTTVAGGTGQSFSGDSGPATQAGMSPTNVAVDGSGNLYIADSHRIRTVNQATGIITTIAGNGQSTVFAGTPGPPTQTAIGDLFSMAVSTGGDVFLGTGRYVLWLSNGTLSVLAGEGNALYAGDGGPATLAELFVVSGLAVDPAGNVFITDAGCYCVRRVAAGSGIIQTVAGTGSAGVSMDGIPATQAALNAGAIAIGESKLYVVDGPQSATARIREVSPAVPPPLPRPPVVTEVVNSVNFLTTYSPGTLVSIFGNYLSSEISTSAEIGANGLVTTNLLGSQALVNGTASPLLYVSPAQINAVVPYSAPSPGYTSLTVLTAGGSGTPYSIYLTRVAPAFYAGLVFNPDGSLNSPTNPAPPGSIVVLYGTGIGQTSPPGVDGSILQAPPFPVPVNSFSAFLYDGGIPVSAPIRYLGPLPDSIAGAVQANIEIPSSIPQGVSTLVVTGPNGEGSNFSSQGVSVYVQPVTSSSNPLRH